MTTGKPKLHIVSLSGGKDSTAMLLMMLEKEMPIDLIIHCDVGLEFPAMYEHLEKLEQHIDIPITKIKATETFEYYLLDHPVAVRGGNTPRTGYGWAGPRSRWCTTLMKTNVIDAYLRPMKKDYDVIEYVGIAADEAHRVKNKCYPLVDWDITEKQALEYCYDKGFDFGGLYELFSRVSCWCCPLQSLVELRTLRMHFPELWTKLRAWDKQQWRQFRADFSVEELERRFAFEEKRLAEGLPITGKEFHAHLRRELADV